jgi:hypothetical protein
MEAKRYKTWWHKAITIPATVLWLRKERKGTRKNSIHWLAIKKVGTEEKNKKIKIKASCYGDMAVSRGGTREPKI